MKLNRTVEKTPKLNQTKTESCPLVVCMYQKSQGWWECKDHKITKIPCMLVFSNGISWGMTAWGLWEGNNEHPTLMDEILEFLCIFTFNINLFEKWSISLGSSIILKRCCLSVQLVMKLVIFIRVHLSWIDAFASRGMIIAQTMECERRWD